MVEKPGIKIIDFDDFVFFTTESKSIILMPGFSQKTTPRCDESHKYGLFYSLRAVFGWRRNRINNVGEFEDVPGGFCFLGD